MKKLVGVGALVLAWVALSRVSAARVTARAWADRTDMLG